MSIIRSSESLRSRASPAARLEEFVRTSKLASDLDCEADPDLYNLASSPDSGSPIGIPGDYGCEFETSSVVNEPVNLSAGYLLPLALPGVKATSRASILEGTLGALLP